ncbi:MAG TPA: VTT domain-containing protein [Terriglobales bacterium]|jgi:membrane protein YqaA with SNARE-associated domain|nr:VTT domain-containing protein [Terriglobales bacterium]
MKTIHYIIAKYTAFLWAILQPLGAWGVFAIATLDSAAVGLPLDVVVGGYIAQNHSRLFLYVLMAAAGSALGSLVIYAIGYTGGEELLRKRVSPERFQKLHGAFEKHPFWSLMFPAMLPPPTPFKIFALGAAVAEMSVSHFILAIFLGRSVRFLLLGILVVRFGPGIIHNLRIFFSHHFHWLVIASLVVLATWLIWRRRHKGQTEGSTEVTEQ